MPLMTLLFMQAALAGWCAYKTRTWLELRGEWLGIPFVVPMAQACMVAAPAGVYMLRFQPSWFLHYVVDPSGQAVFDTYAFLFSVGLLMLLGVVTWGGFSVVRYAVVRMLAPFCVFPAVGLGAVGILLFLGFWRRSFHVGAWDQLRTNEAVMLWDHVVGALGLAWLATALFAVWLSGRVFRDDKTVAPRTSMPSLPPV